jgi:hypothetical protein
MMICVKYDLNQPTGSKEQYFKNSKFTLYFTIFTVLPYKGCLHLKDFEPSIPKRQCVPISQLKLTQQLWRS